MEGFLSEDKEKAFAFGQFISRHAKWELTTQEACDLNRHLLWYNSLEKKIEAHIFEVIRKHDAPKDFVPPVPPSEPERKKK